MLYGMFLVVGIVALIVSRFLYGMYDIRLGGDDNNNIIGSLALALDITSIIIIVYSLYNGVFL